MGLTKYMDESERKLTRWKKEKDTWYKKYKEINNENDKLTNENRKLQRDNKRLQRKKKEIEKQLSMGSQCVAPKKPQNENIFDTGNDGDMNIVTIEQLRNRRRSFVNIPDLLRTYDTLKKNHYNNVCNIS